MSDAADAERDRTSGWTGGQYSLYRVLLAVGLAGAIATGLPAGASGLSLVGGAAALAGCGALAVGWRDRIVAVLLGVGVVARATTMETTWPGGRWLDGPGVGLATFGVLLLLHACVPPAPFGSLDARGRIDPRGGWQRPRWLGDLAWAFVVLVVARGAAVSLLGLSPEADLPSPGIGRASAGLELALALGGLARGLRPRLWLALGLWHVGWWAAFAATSPDPCPFLLLMLFAADPGWWPGRSAALADLRTTRRDETGTAPHAVLYYDGDCGFCHRSVRVVLSEETGTPEPLRLRFAPLQSAHFTRHVASRPDVDVDALPDSIVLRLEDGRLLTRSAAALEIAARLGGAWRVLARLLGALPSAWLDAAYDAIARVRKRIFAAPKDACPILPPDLRTRFDY
ncbi:MAG: DUF393 domain-containing protein [Myxococcales bacterium]|nr:DUF393 domain-containing protein [Myxococcales bacterium]